VVSFLVASSAKQSVVLLPVILLAWDYIVEKRRHWGMFVDKAPFFVISLFFGLMNMEAQPSTGTALSGFVVATSQLMNFWLLSGLGDYVLYRPRPDPASVTVLVQGVVIGSAAVLWLLPLLFYRLRLASGAVLSLWILICMVPPMVLSFLTPVTDRYLFLPSVGSCILVAGLVTHWVRMSPRARLIGWIGLGVLGSVWTWKTVEYVRQWRDPRTVWYFAAPKARSCQAYEFSGNVYQDSAERISSFLRTGTNSFVPADKLLAGTVLSADELRQLEAEWAGVTATRTNSTSYRDRLWSIAWGQYEKAVPLRGTLNAPNLFMRRGMVLVGQGRHEQGIKEFEVGLGQAQTHTYEPIRLEMTTLLQRSIGIAYWNLKSYQEAREWLLKAQETQRKAGRTFVSTLDNEVERIKRLASRQPAQ
jgi:hypothetical protein